MKQMISRYGLVLLLLTLFSQLSAQQLPAMYFSDSSKDASHPTAKDPSVIRFKGSYLMYYSVPPRGALPWRIGVAASRDLTHWHKVAELKPEEAYEQNGLCAAGAFVRGEEVHLFYQTYGNRSKDAVCHAVSADGIHFTRDATNPVFHPAGDWTCGRAIDAEVVRFQGRYLLYFATRDSAFKIQKVGVAASPLSGGFHRRDWMQLADFSVLKPELGWEKQCIEAPSCLERNGRLYMFYAGAYNNAPQQIGVAVSHDGIHWKRLSDKPFLSNGLPGSWNASESGHPCIFQDVNGETWLFFQGNNTRGKTWFISRKRVLWKGDMPYLADEGPADDTSFFTN